MNAKPPLKKRRRYDKELKGKWSKIQIAGVSENLIYGWKSKRKAKGKETAQRVFGIAKKRNRRLHVRYLTP